MCKLSIAACVLLLATAAWPQDSDEPAPSLGNLARQTRAQHAASQGQPNKAQQFVDDMQRAQEASENAPTGFTSYDAGDYRLFVPSPFSIESQDANGTVLVGSQVGVTNAEVMAGNPVPVPPYVTDDNSMTGFVGQLAQRYTTAGSSCTAVTPASTSADSANGSAQPSPHKVFRCALMRGNLLGHEVSGSMEFVVASNGVIPVLCVSPNVSHQQCGTTDAYGYHPCPQRIVAGYVVTPPAQPPAVSNKVAEEQNSWRMCDQIVYPSITLKEDIVVHPRSIGDAKPAATAGHAVLQDTSVVTGSESLSPAEVARQTRLAQANSAGTAASSAAGSAPAGFRPFLLNYCVNPQHCAEAGVTIPDSAEIVSHVNGQHIFKTVLDGDPMLLYAGPADVNAPYRNLTDGDWVRMRDMATAMAGAREKTEAVSTQNLNIDGNNAIISRFRYQRDEKRWWVAERLLITLPGGQFLLACTAPEEHFVDAQRICTSLENSLRLP